MNTRSPFNKLTTRKKARQAKMVKTKSGLRLTPSQEAFARAYTSFGEETFCNAYQSMISTRNWNGKKETAYSYAAQLKRHPVITQRIRELLEAQGFNDEDVDMEHLKVIKQDKDLSNKMRGIQEYNRLRGRGVQQGQQVTVNIINFSDVLKQQQQRDNATVSVRPIDSSIPTGDSGASGQK